MTRNEIIQLIADLRQYPAAIPDTLWGYGPLHTISASEVVELLIEDPARVEYG